MENMNDPAVSAMLQDAQKIHHERSETELPDMDYTSLPIDHGVVWLIRLEDNGPVDENGRRIRDASQATTSGARHKYTMWMYDQNNVPRYVEDHFIGLPDSDQVLRFVVSHR